MNYEYFRRELSSLPYHYPNSSKEEEEEREKKERQTSVF